ncbi:SDR family oxidoreductase [Candidatus Pelagibacter sp.]|nr:SDR family oxidoreductase [Candidatus Pelagibacter sp.]
MQDKKIVVVTGSFQGNGVEISKIFLNNNSKVYCLDFRYKKKIENDKDLTKYKINLENKNEILKFCSFIKKKEKKIDCLINNAGVSLNKKKESDYWEKTIKINLTAPYLLSENLISLLKKSNNASIINISSIAAKIAMSENAAYNVSKAGLISLTESQAFDYSKFKIRSNSICPGYIKTNMTKKSFSNFKMKKKRLDRLNIKRYGSPVEIANLAFYLSKKEAAYINAQTIIIDGGLIKRGI